MARIVGSKNSLTSSKFIDSTKFQRTSDIEQKHTPFELQLKMSHVKRELDQLLVDIDQQGKALAKNLTLQDLKKYRNLVSSFIKKATEEMYSLKMLNGDYFNPHKEYLIIEKIDEQLEKITESLLNNEQNNLFILDKINYIKGLLLNIAI